ncbi:MAG: hypothetical protein ACRD45_15580 [Bryobacteraceae bacterium]
MSGVEVVVQAASRRRLLVLVAEQAAFPCAVALGGAAVLLVLGTDILHWFWPALLAGAAAAYAAVRIRRRILPSYRVAQMLDRRLGLNDSLATAWFLLSRDSIPRTTAASFQIEQAEHLAASVGTSDALPFTSRRRWVLAAALFALALALFTIRYARIESLSLHQPLIPVPGAASASSEAVFSPRLPSPDGSEMARRSGANRQSKHSGTTGATAGSSSGAESGKSAQQNQSVQLARVDGTHKSALGGHAASAPSLLRRMQEALASLAAGLRAHIGGKGGSGKEKQTESAQSLARPQTGHGRQGNRQRGSGAAAKQARKQAAGLRRAQTSARRGSQPRSGIGSRNGDKDVKRAQDLAAMGKLTEILGKRSADLTGDVTVRSAPGTAALRTPETGRLGRHKDLGGTIRRDQVPPIYRDYVKRYMEAVRTGMAR